MPAGDRDFDGAFHVTLTFDIGEIDVVVLVGREKRTEIAANRLQFRFSPNELKGFAANFSRRGCRCLRPWRLRAHSPPAR